MAAGTRRGPRAGVSPARRCAFKVIRRVFEEGAFADRAFQSEAKGLPDRERAFAMALAYTTVQRRRTLDYVATKLTSSPPEKLDPPVLAALRLGLCQLLLLDRVAAHAAVNESVELVKRHRPAAASLLNAVLRRAAREGRALIDELDERTADEAALVHSVPDWLAELWWRELGEARALSLLRQINEPAESALRVNTLLSTREQVLSRLGVPAQPAPGLPEGLVLEAPFDAHGSELFERGMVTPQSRASMLVARILAPEPRERSLDLCAAPGGKTTHLAALIGNVGEVVAVERHPGRAEALGRTCRRMGATAVSVLVADATAFSDDAGFQRILVDPPCSGLGTLQSRPDLRWRQTPEAIAELAALQRKILATAARTARPGASVVYSVCTISRTESVDVIERFLAEHPRFRADDLQGQYPQWGHPGCARHLQLLPDRDGTDGFFIARLRCDQ